MLNHRSVVEGSLSQLPGSYRGIDSSTGYLAARYQSRLVGVSSSGSFPSLHLLVMKDIICFQVEGGANSINAVKFHAIRDVWSAIGYNLLFHLLVRVLCRDISFHVLGRFYKNFLHWYTSAALPKNSGKSWFSYPAIGHVLLEIIVLERYERM